MLRPSRSKKNLLIKSYIEEDTFEDKDRLEPYVDEAVCDASTEAGNASADGLELDNRWSKTQNRGVLVCIITPDILRGNSWRLLQKCSQQIQGQN